MTLARSHYSGLALRLMALTVLTTMCVCAQTTAPQVKNILPAYEGQNVSSVEVAGRTDINPAEYERLISQKAGEPFSKQKVDESVAQLKSLGKFKDVVVNLEPEATGVRILFVVQPALYYGVYRFPGAAQRFPYTRLLQATNYPSFEPYSPVDVNSAADSLAKFLQRTGYFESKVRAVPEPDYDRGLVNIIFHVTLGRRAHIGEIHLEGTSPELTKQLKDKLGSFMARLRTSSLRPGQTYTAKRLHKATTYLQTTLNKEHFLAAQVKLVSASYNPETNHADITFKVDTGKKVSIKTAGAGLWSRTEQKLIPMFQVNQVNDGLILEGQRNLISYLESKGYFDAKVKTDVREDSTGTHILYVIQKGPRNRVDDVHISGNKHLSDDELAARVAIKKGGFLSHGKFSEQLLRKSVSNLEGVYRAAGYPQAKVSPQIKREEDGDVSVAFRVDEGPLDEVASLNFEGNTVDPATLAPHGLKLGPGKPYSQQLLQQDRNEIMARYLSMGYLIASFKSTAKPSASDPHKLDVVYQITEGPRVETKRVMTVGRRHTKQSLIRTTAALRPETPLTETEMLASESRLYNLQVFDWAEVDPRRQITTQNDEDVVIKLHEAKRNSITYGFGFEVINRGGSVPSGTVAVPGVPPVGLPQGFRTSQKTFWGPRGSVEYTRKNMRGRAETLTLGAFGGRLNQRGSINYEIPSFRNSSWKENTTLSGEHNSENPIFTSRQGEAGFQFQRNIDAKGTKSVFLRYSYRVTSLSNLLIPELVPSGDTYVRLSTVSGSFVRDTRDNPLDAHKGIYESFEIGINPKALGSNVNFARLLGQTAYYKGIGAGIVWANSLRIGLEQAFGNSHVPISETFFTGGGSTLRGFPLNGAGPQRTITACGNPQDPSTCGPITVPVGGNQLFILNSELRVPVPFDLPLIGKKLGVVGFYDGGNVYQQVGFHNFGSDYTNSVGFGIRYSTPVGPVRLDIGHNLNSIPGIKSTQIFVTLGQAF